MIRPWRPNSRPIALQVLMNRGSVALISPSSASGKTLASRSFPPRTPVRAPREGFHAPARIGSRKALAWPRQNAARLQASEQRFVAHSRQALVDKHLRRREDDAAIDVVLVLQRCGIADADRPVPL